MMETTRLEHDTFGEIAVPAARLWGAQTQRSLRNFSISTEKPSPELIRALALVKRAAAAVNRALGVLPEEKARVIMAAADEIIAGRHAEEFPLAIWQTGSGTQTHINLNEVIANRASELAGGGRGSARASSERRCQPRPILKRCISNRNAYRERGRHCQSRIARAAGAAPDAGR